MFRIFFCKEITNSEGVRSFSKLASNWKYDSVVAIWDKLFIHKYFLFWTAESS